MTEPGPEQRQSNTDNGKAIAGLAVAGITLTAALGWWCARRRKQPVITDVTHAPTAERSKPAQAHQHRQRARQLMSAFNTVLPLLQAWQRNQVARRATAPQAPLDRLKESAALGLLPPSTPDVTPDLGPEAAVAHRVAVIRAGPWYQQVWQFTSAAINAWLENFAPSMGAAIAYYTIFSIAPILVIAIAIAGMLFGQDAAQGEIVEQIRSIVGTDGAIAVQALLRSVSTRSDGVIATALSLITLAIGATAVFAELQSALDRIWRIPVAVRSHGLWGLIRTRLLSFGLILGLGFMLMVSLVVSAALAALGKWWSGWFEGWGVMIQLLNFLISFLVFTALFAAIYKLMPRVSLSWHDVRIGALATAVLFIIGKYLIGIYLAKTGMSSGFGAAGSFALLLAWIYYSAQIFLLGAEFTWIYAHNYGSRQRLRAPRPVTPA